MELREDAGGKEDGGGGLQSGEDDGGTGDGGGETRGWGWGWRGMGAGTDWSLSVLLIDLNHVSLLSFCLAPTSDTKRLLLTHSSVWPKQKHRMHSYSLAASTLKYGERQIPTGAEMNTRRYMYTLLGSLLCPATGNTPLTTQQFGTITVCFTHG